MNYLQNYYNYIDYVKTLNRVKLPKNNVNYVYYEEHHILPRSIFPEYKNLLGNKILLTAREHFLAHYLLTKIYNNGLNYYKMAYAFHFISSLNNRIMSSRNYEKIRLALKDAIRYNSMNTETFIERAKLIHGDRYDYSKVDYHGGFIKVKIICKKHGEFEQKAYKHLIGQGCTECYRDKQRAFKKDFSNYEFIEKAKNKHGNKYDYSEINYQGVLSIIKVRCDKHGWFETEAYKFLRSGCAKCGYERQGNSIRSNTEKFIKKAKLIHGDKYDYSKVDYIRADKRVKIICKEHGEFEQMPCTHLDGAGCSECGKLIKMKKYRIKIPMITTQEWIKKAKSIHGNKYDYSLVDYQGCQTKVKIICKEHGEFKQIPSAHLKGNNCPKCGHIARNYTRYHKPK
jgi:hypothetical protein